MKMLFITGKIGDNTQGIGINKINFTTFDTGIIQAFDESLWQILGVISRYDVEFFRKINGKDIFYFYDKKSNKKLILKALENIILNGNYRDVINYEDAMIKEAIESRDLNEAMRIKNGHQVLINETIFWDVLNHLVIIIGKDELRRFAYTLEEERYKSYTSIFKGSTIKDFVKNETLSEPTKRMILLSSQS